jgi:DNA topoisomerase-3
MGKLVVWIAESRRLQRPLPTRWDFLAIKAMQKVHTFADGNIKFTWAFGHLLRIFNLKSIPSSSKPDLKNITYRAGEMAQSCYEFRSRQKSVL